MSEIETIEFWLRRYDFEHAQICYDDGMYLAQTLLSREGAFISRWATGNSIIEAVTNWQLKYESTKGK